MDIYILHDGQQSGPFSEETARQMLNQGVVLGTDPAWRTGMPEWLPLNSILHSEENSQAAASEAPAQEAASTAPTAEESQTQKAERPQRFLELCQTQGAAVIEGITRAHCQVLVGYLDGKFPNWDAGDEAEAARKYFFPAVAEKFPQFVRPEWKGKLQYPQAPKTAPSPQPRVSATPKVSSSPTRKASSPAGAFFKGFFFGLVVVTVAVGGLVAYKRPDLVEQAKAELQAKFSGNAKTANQEPASEPASASSESKPSSSTAGSTAKQDAPAKASAKKRTAATAKTPAQESPATAMNSVPAPELPEPSSTPGSTSTALFDPTPNPAPTGGAMAGESASGLSAPKTSVKLLQTLELQSTYGKIQIPAGTQLPIVEQDGVNVKVRFQNQTVSVPANATDLGDSGLQSQ